MGTRGLRRRTESLSESLPWGVESPVKISRSGCLPIIGSTPLSHLVVSRALIEAQE
jgi:hypothetical protein